MILLIAKCCMFNWCLFRNGYLAAGGSTNNNKMSDLLCREFELDFSRHSFYIFIFPRDKIDYDMKLLETSF